MKKLTLDGSYSSDKESLYEYLNKKIQLQENNLDAVYGYFAAITEDMQVTLVNAQKLKENLGNYGGSFIKMLQKAEQRNRHLKVRMVYREAERKFADKKDVRAGNEKKESESGNGRGERCPYAGKCGGCSGQKKTYEEETHLKQRWVENILGKLTNVDDILTMENPYHYRHKVHAVFSTDRKGRVIAGGYQENTHKVVDIDACRIEEEKAGAIIRTIKEMLPSFKIRPYDEDRGTGVLRHVLIRSGYATGQLLVVLVTGTAVFPARNNFVKELVRRHPEITSVVQNINDKKTSMVLGNRENVLYGRGYIEDELCGRRFRISPKSFYQVNPEQTEKLYQAAIECACLTGEEKVIDAYCGIGTIGIIAAGHAAEVTGVELNRDAVKDARVNAKINGVDNITFYNVDAGKFMVEMAERKKQADVVFMDPPRSGSTEEFLDSVVKLAPERVVYVSCNPETLERDLVYLMKRQYQIKSCRVIDLFPWTGHVETVVLLSQRKADDYVEVELELDELDVTSAESKATYKEIQEYVLKEHGLKVSNLYISQVKRKCGIEVGENYNLPKTEDSRQPQCPEEKEKAIRDALEHFGMV